MKPEFELGVLFRNNEDLVGPCLWAARNCTKVPFRVIAVDQASTDLTAEELARFIKPKNGDVILPPGTNTGVAAGRNQILKYRTPELPLVLMDSDVIISMEETLEHMVALIGEGIAGVYGNMLSGRFRAPETRPDPENGFAFVALSPKALQRVPRFDERFDMFCDDSWFIDQIIAAGMKFISCRQSVAVHYWGSTIRRGSESKRSHEVDRKDSDAYAELKNEKSCAGKFIQAFGELDMAENVRLHRTGFMVSLEEARWLCHKAAKSQGNILEIGCHHGVTTRELAMHNPDRIIFAVDFLGAPVNPEQAVETPDLEMVATAARGMTNVFISLQDSRSFDYTGKNIRLVFIDGDHSYRAVKADTELAMLAHHRQGGRMTIVWHDYIHEPTPDTDIHWIGVSRYLRELSANGFEIKHVSGTVLAYLDLP